MLKEILQGAAELYSQDGKGKKATVYAVLEAINGWKWYITEYSKKENLAFGYVQGFEEEWGYISIEELEENIKLANVYILSTEHKTLEEYL